MIYTIVWCFEYRYYLENYEDIAVELRFLPTFFILGTLYNKPRDTENRKNSENFATIGLVNRYDFYTKPQPNFHPFVYTYQF